MICDRCGAETRMHTMSMFNRDEICMPCKDDERLTPGYARAERAESLACRAGNYNFGGVGLAADDRAFLVTRRMLRTTA